MSDVVNPARSTYRREQADATRVRIADAAQRLFAEQGYGATSMQMIARAAGVADRTVYVAFGSKREILSAICERWLDRAEARTRAAAVHAIPRPAARLRGAAGWLVHLYSTDFDVVRILDSAVDEDAETRHLLQGKLRGRNGVMDGFIASIEPSLQVPLADAQAVFRAYAAAGFYGELVVGSGWSPERFADFLADTLVGQLLEG